MKEYTSTSTHNIVGRGLIKVVEEHPKAVKVDEVVKIDDIFYRIRGIEAASHWDFGYAKDIGLLVREEKAN